VNNNPDIHDHDHAETLLGDYVMGTTTPEDQAWMDQHIATCEQCQEELPDLLDALAALPFGAEEPPVALRDEVWNRIEATIAAQDAPGPANDGVNPGPVSAPPPEVEMRRSPQHHEQTLSNRWLIGVAAVLAVIILGAVLAQVLPGFGGDDDKAESIAFAFTDESISANGDLEYFPGEQKFEFSSTNMPDLDGGQVYQAWLIKGDEPPVPGGVMDPETGKLEISGDRAAYDTFAVTVEPGPEGSTTPTSDPVLTAPLNVEGTR